MNENLSAFRPALDAPLDISLIVDAEGTIGFASPDAARFYGVEAAHDLGGRSMFDLIVPDDRARARDWWAALCESDAPDVDLRLGALRPDEQPAQVHVVAMRLPDDGPHYLLKHHVEDITRERLATLYSILLATSGTLDLDALIDTVLGETLHLIPADSVTAFLEDRDGHLQVMRSSGPHPERLSPDEIEAVGTFKTTQIVRETGRALLIADCTTDPNWVRLEGSKHIRSWLGAPLNHQGDYLGLLALNSTRPNRFGPEDADLLLALASQVASALYNIFMYDEKQRRARQFEAISDVSLALGHVDLSELLEVVYRKINRLMDATTFYIGLYNPETEMLRITGAYDHDYYRDDELQRAGEGLAGRVLKSREPVIILDTADGSLPQEAIIDGEVPRSILMMPLIAQDELVGVISVQSYQPNAYTPEDIALLETLAGPVASAIQNVQLFEETSNRLAMLEAIHRLGLALAAGHDLQGVADLILSATQDLFLPREVWIYLAEDPSWGPAYLLERHTAGSDGTRDVRVLRGESVFPMGELEHVLRSTHPAILSTESADGLDQFATGWPVHMAALCPIRFGGQALGALLLLYDLPYPMTSDTLRGLDLIAMQAATAFDNVRYHISLRRRLDEVSALYELAQRVSSSQSLDDILRIVVRTVQQVFECRSVSIGLLDEDASMVVVRASIGIDARLLPKARFKLGEPVAGRVVSTGSVIYVPDTRANRDFRVIDPAIRALLCVPLTVQDRAIGALSVDSEQPYAFTSDHERMLTIAGGQIAAAIQTMHLLNESRERAAQLAEANVNLQELDALRDELIANVSHELRSPLSLVRGYAGLLRAEELGPITSDQAEALDVVEDKASSIGRLIDDILALERIRHDALELSPIELNELCERACTGTALIHSGRDLHFETQLVPGTYTINGDRVRLNQVLDNLLGNAAKFSPDSETITLRTSVDPPGTRFAISIIDHGIGIPADKLERIFERFFQGDRMIKHRYGGAGLGLSIVQRIIEAHGGRVHVESQEGKGSTFTVVLPLEPERPHEDV
ncbi:GAF domain-containing protein [Aggregatilinea lenta]|uniref:GAF domain-containing protein n=1 Tax=Aggregatilinea lenta TaxID=913108 RepID=UPI0013C2F827|nr:GAF domain-containing protein [Aggregatilinea lenta]